ncbi:MAG: GTPase [Phycisphaeraceae bacterium]
MTRVTLATANTPGAVAIVQLHGEGVVDVLQQLTGKADWQARRVRLCHFADIDEGLAVLLNDQAAQLMPHGGPRVVQKLIEHLTAKLGCAYDATPDAQALYPEANSPIEADMLDAIARAASPAAIDLLAAQPALWAGLLKQAGLSPTHARAILERSRILDRLINPPTVVVVGPANVGKSTLTNALMGRSVSLVADLPGTTRDWVGALVELSATGSTRDAVAVNWLDTPGLRTSDDAVEQRAIALARKQIARADVLIAMRDPEQDWPDASALPREPDLWVVNKVDDTAETQHDWDGISPEKPLQISAANNRGIDRLQDVVVDRLGLSSFSPDTPWAFSGSLCDAIESCDLAMLARYCGAQSEHEA